MIFGTPEIWRASSSYSMRLSSVSRESSSSTSFGGQICSATVRIFSSESSRASCSTVSGKNPLIVAKRGSSSRKAANNLPEACCHHPMKIRKNAPAFFAGQGQGVLVAVQRRDAGRAEHEISFTNIKERRFRPAGDQLVQLDRSRSRTCTEPAAPIFSYSCCRSKHLSVTALAMTNSAEREVLLPGKPTIRYPWIPQTLAKKKMLRYSNRIQNQKGI